MVQLKTLTLALCLLAPAAARKHMREVQLHRELQLLQEETRTGDSVGVKVTALQKAVPEVHWESVSLPIDHTGEYPGNFSNRFWVMDEFYEPGNPVFTLDTGESEGGDGYLRYLTSNATFFYQYLQEFKAMGIVWEHRYYGTSSPFTIDLDTTAEQMRFLTTENALKDFDVFANQFKWGQHDLNPKKTPWIVVGGSYPGMRAAFLRHLFPETVYASYASSAPVQAQTDMSVYMEQVYRGMVHYGLKNCTENVKHAVDYIDERLDKKSTAAQIKLQYLGKTADKGSNAGFADTLMFPFYNWQSGGVDPIIREFCDFLNAGSAKEVKDASHKSGGLGKYYSDRWAAWPGFIDLVNDISSFGYCEGPNGGNGTEPDCLLDERFTGGIGISWTWQYCTEWGYFQPTNIGPHALGSRYNSLQHQQEICYRQFPDGLSSGLLPRKPDNRIVNELTDGWRMRPSNVFWTGGQFDPWRTLSPLSDEKWSPNFKHTEKAPKCGVSTARDTVFGHILPESEHCYDFRATPKAKVAQDMFRDALKGWLKCFGKK